MISVCMTTYNGDKYLKRQISSILKQLSADDELIISDDGSSDHTLELLNSFNDKRILILHHTKKAKNKNKIHSHYLISSNFENALSYATGDVIFLSDQDDIWTDNKVDIMLSYLQNYSLVMSDFLVINENDNVVSDSFFNLISLPRGIFKNIYKPVYHGCCMAFKKEILEVALPFPKKMILHDSWIGIMAENFGKTKYIKEKLVLYRKHLNNSSSAGDKSQNTLFFQFSYRVIFLCQVIKRIIYIKLNKNLHFASNKIT